MDSVRKCANADQYGGNPSGSHRNLLSSSPHATLIPPSQCAVTRPRNVRPNQGVLRLLENSVSAVTCHSRSGSNRKKSAGSPVWNLLTGSLKRSPGAKHQRRTRAIYVSTPSRVSPYVTLTARSRPVKPLGASSKGVSFSCGAWGA